jgi:hypothetical protein
MEQEIFSIGQTVNWSEFTNKWQQDQYGFGPFRIHSVIDVPLDKCSCGGSFEDETHKSYGRCPYSHRGYGRVIDSVGHPQWVTISNDVGEILRSPKGEVREFSGLYFKAS